MRKMLAVVALVFALISAAYYLTTFVVPIGHGALFLLIVVNLSFGFIAILLGRDHNDRPFQIRFPRKAPRWVEHVLGVLVLFCIANFAVVALRGTPISGGPHPIKKTISGRYLEISTTEYESLRASENRLFTSLWVALNTGLALTLWFKHSHRQPRRKEERSKVVL